MTLRKKLITIAAVLGAAVGSAVIAGAVTTTAQVPTDATESPSYTGSVQAPPEDETLSDADEAALLADLATVTEDEAKAAATAAVPGDVQEIELDDENGFVVYSVEIIDTSGAEVDVKIDAGDGSVLSQQADDDDDASDEADDVNEAPDADDDASSADGPAGS